MSKHWRVYRYCHGSLSIKLYIMTYFGHTSNTKVYSELNDSVRTNDIKSEVFRTIL